MDVNVLVVFYSRYGNAERLALAAGVGAIQSRANIRLRRVPDVADEKAIAADALWTENLRRMNLDYVAPREGDAPWADVIFLATPADTSTEMERYLAVLRAQGPMFGKIAAPFSPGNKVQTLAPLYSAAAAAGMIVVPQPVHSGYAVELATSYGRQVVEIARALKTRSPASSA